MPIHTNKQRRIDRIILSIGQPNNATIITLTISVLLVLALFGLGILGSVEVTSVSGASAILSTTSQANATLAGFVLVAVVFIIERRGLNLTKGWPLRNLDLVFFGIALFLLITNVSDSISSLGLIHTEGTTIEDIAHHAERNVFYSSLAIGFMIAGVGLLLGITIAGARTDSSSNDEGNSLENAPQENDEGV